MTSAVGVGKGFGAATAYSFGKITAVAAALALHGLDHLAAEHNGICNLAYCDGQVTRCLDIAGAGAEIITVLLGAENLHAAFRAKENDSLFGDGDTLKFNGLSGADTAFEYKLGVKTNVNAVKAAIELNRLNRKLCPNDACGFNADVVGFFYNVLTAAGQKNAYVFIAVLVTAAVEYTIDIYSAAVFHKAVTR